MALQGTLDTFALPDVLRLLATTAKTGRLRLDGDRGHGSVWLRDGTVMAATADRAVDDAPAEEVIFELLRFEEGAFAFEADALSPDGEQPEDVEILLRNAGALLSEWNELVSVVPSLDHRVGLVDSLPGGEVTIDARRWTGLVAVASGRTVREVASTLGLSELGATRAVRDLVDIGVVELQEPSDEAVPPPPRDEAPHHEMARRSPFSSLGSGETLATSVPPRPDNTGEMLRAGWLQSPPSGSHTAVPDGLAPSSSADHGPGGAGNGAGAPSGPGLSPRGAHSGSQGSSGKRPGSGATRASSSRSASGPSRSSSGRAGTGKRSPSSGRSGAGAGATGSASGSGRDPGVESRRPAASGGPANGERSRFGKGRQSGPSRRNGPGGHDTSGGPPTLPDTGPLSMPPASPAAFDAGPLGPSPLPAETGQIRPVSPASLPPDLQWAVDDDSPAAMGPSGGPFAGHGGSGPRGNGPGPRGNGGPPFGGQPVGGTPVDPNKVAPHVAAMSPEAAAAVQGAVGNTGGTSSSLGPGEELAQRGQLLHFLSSVRP